MAGSGVNEGFGMAAEKGSGHVPVAQSIRHPPTKREIASSSPVGDYITSTRLSPTNSIPRQTNVNVSKAVALNIGTSWLSDVVEETECMVGIMHQNSMYATL